MKIRNGFVSNSSSSSFVVVFPTEPKSVEDVKKYLFKEDQQYFLNPYDDDNYTVGQVAETVWNDICSQEKNKFKDIISEISSGSLDVADAPDYNDFYHITDWNQRWKAYDDACEKHAKKIANKMFNLRKMKLKKINGEEITEAMYIFEYSDNDGSYFSSLEHGDLFRNLKHVRISKH